MPPALLEKQVLEIWQRSLQRRTDLVTAENEPIAVIYPGRPNDDRGADFRDAVIATGQGLLRGDIEIHVKSSHWWTHRHHRDPVYNRVVLHVVYWDDAARTVVLENGFKVPTLVLHNYCAAPAAREIPPGYASPIPMMPCRTAGHSRNTVRVNQVLEKAGEARFLASAARFREMIVASGPGQALYRGIMTALGYSRNKEAMAELSRCLPLRRLEAAAAPSATDGACLAQYQARLTGAAGLLPSQRGAEHRTGYPVDEWVGILEKTWAACGEKQVMAAADWHFFKVRPGNYPVRRLAAMSYLLLRYRKKGLLAGLGGILQAVAKDKAGRRLELALLVNPDSFWGRYLDFDMPAGGIIPALLGRERAAEIVVNVLLPLAAAAGFTDTPGLPEKALAIFRGYHAAAANTLVKHMSQQLGIGRHSVNTARRQQGLIHIYKTRCSQGKCGECPLNQVVG
jgi:hypothetical protein